jgi:hypothetical protein
LTGTYTCTIPDGYQYDQSDIQVGVYQAGGTAWSILYNTQIDMCDGQPHEFTMEGF